MGIPSYWQNEKLGSLATQITKGTTPTTAGFQYQPEGVPFIKVENIIDGQVALKSVTQFISPEAHSSLKRSQFQVGDVLFSIAGTIGKTALVDESNVPANTNQAVAIIRGVTGCFIPSFLKLQLQEAARRIQVDHARGGAMNNVSLADLKGVTVSVPPLAEQKVIADKLDTLLAQVETTKARLERIPQILKRFRQSVLAAAVSGRLTGGTFVSLGTLKNVADIVSGVAFKKAQYSNSGSKLLQIANVGYGDTKWDSVSYIPSNLADDFSTYSLAEGDIVMALNRPITNDTLKVAAVSVDDLPATLYQRVARIRSKPELLNSRYLFLLMQSPDFRKKVKLNLKGSDQPYLNTSSLGTFEIHAPKLGAQNEIVRRVDQLFAHADRIELQVNNALARINNLTQSILAKAFRGDLTEQWRRDNPELISRENSAEALLERIKAERAAAKPAKKIRKKMSS